MNLNVLKDSSEVIYYNNPSIPIYVRKSDLDSFPNREALCHWHEDVEFLVALKGHISYKINGQTFLLEEGEAIFVNSRQMHYGYSDDQTNCEYICIVFDPRTVFSSQTIHSQYVDPILDSSLSELQIKADKEAGIKILASICQLYELYHLRDSTIELKAMSCLYQLWESLFLLLRPALDPAISIYDSNLTTLKRMLSFIYNNYGSRISLSDIADSGDIGKSKCCMLFKHYLNHSPNMFLNSYRLEKSMILLRDPDFNVTDAVYACGFSNPSYFAELFLKNKGCTPSEYKSEYKVHDFTQL